MKSSRKYLSYGTQLVLLVVLLVVLIFAINSLNSRSRAVQDYPPPQGTPLPFGTSTPPETSLPYGTPTPPETSTIDEQSRTATAMSPTQGTEISITLPPPLVLTNPIGPLATPFPLVTPAPDAAGSITYLARDRDGTVSAYSLEVDQDGQVRSDPRVISRIDVPVDNVYPSPGGRRMALVGNRPQFNFLDLNTGEVFGVRTDIIVENFLAWHPDNQHILVRGGGGLFLLNIDTGDTIQLATTVDSGGSFDEGAISPDGQRVIASFSRYVFDPVQTLIFNMDGSNERFLSLGITRMDHFTWSPDGSQIAFCGDEGLVVMDAEGSHLENLQDTSAMCQWPVTWSPASHSLAAVANHADNPLNAGLGNGQPEKTEINLIDVDSGGIRMFLPGNNSANLDPVWSPDGSLVAFVYVQNGQSQLWIANADGSNPHQVTRIHQAVRFLHWSKP